MKKPIIKSFLVAAILAISLISHGNTVLADEYVSITAQEAYEMVACGAADMLDVRTLEEIFWLGSPALIPGDDPISYAIPWKFYIIDPDGKFIIEANPDFDALVEETFSDKDFPIIIICKNGARSSEAAVRLIDLGYTDVYEIDNAIKNGRGGFQGSNYTYIYEGYLGYPGRLPQNMDPHRINVKLYTDKITNENDSVSWMDTGLPITDTQIRFKIKIPTLP